MTMLITGEGITRDTLLRKDTIIRFQCKGRHSLRGQSPRSFWGIYGTTQVVPFQNLVDRDITWMKI
jgi:hypothetical protein